MKNLTPPTFMLICLIGMIALHWIFPLWLITNGFILISRVWFMLFGIVLAVAAEGQFRRSGTAVDHLSMPTKLVTDGWFKWSRNPMYLSFVLMLIGAWLLLGSLLPLLGILIYFFFTERWYILPEENRLAATFGKQYESYRKSTLRWL